MSLAHPTPPAEHLSKDWYDALVIGTGFGGSVAACRLAQAGVDVAVIERGRRWVAGTFPRDVAKLDDGWLWVCEHGLYDARPLNDILTVQAAGYGGGSLVYANVAARPPEEVFDDNWPGEYSRESLDPYYDLVAHMLEVRPVTADPRTGELPPKSRFMQTAAHELDREEGFFHPNLAVTFGERGEERVNRFGVRQSSCTFSGECGIGCNEGAKNSLDHNYLALAERHGAAIGTRTEAVHIGTTDGGYRVRLREYGHDGDGKDGLEREVTARHVFVCAGAIGTTELLLRSRDQYGTLPDLPSALGHGYSGNGDFLTFGDGLQQPFRPEHGPVITTATVVRAGEGAGENWFVLEDGGYSRHIARLVQGLHVSQLPAHVASAVSAGARRLFRHANALGGELDPEANDIAVVLSMGRDRADGVISLDGPRHRLRVRWDVPRNGRLYALERAASGDVVRSAGGQPFGTPTWRLFQQPVTVHNLGGARMGDGPSTGVVDSDGQVFGHPGLYVLDGAALPGATGANPSMTIAAVAERNIEAAIRDNSGDTRWVAPESHDVVRGDIPEDRAVAAVVGRGPRPAPAPGVQLNETMTGTIRLADGPHEVEMRLDVRVPDLAAFLADPTHTAQLGGTIEVDGLTAGAAPVRDGSLNIMAPVDGSAKRTLDYAVPFDDSHGVQWLLQGSKLVEPVWVSGPWRSTTTLDISLTSPDDRHDGLVPTGRLKISVSDVARLPLSMRGTGAPSRAAGLRTVARFSGFFANAMLRAFFTRRR